MIQIQTMAPITSLFHFLRAFARAVSSAYEALSSLSPLTMPVPSILIGSGAPLLFFLELGAVARCSP